MSIPARAMRAILSRSRAGRIGALAFNNNVNQKFINTTFNSNLFLQYFDNNKHFYIFQVYTPFYYENSFVQVFVMSLYRSMLYFLYGFGVEHFRGVGGACGIKPSCILFLK